jgi:hypothetical protein
MSKRKLFGTTEILKVRWDGRQGRKAVAEN